MSEDFSSAKRGAVVQSDPTKERITIRLDRDIVDRQALERSCATTQVFINIAAVLGR